MTIGTGTIIIYTGSRCKEWQQSIRAAILQHKRREERSTYILINSISLRLEDRIVEHSR